MLGTNFRLHNKRLRAPLFLILIALVALAACTGGGAVDEVPPQVTEVPTEEVVTQPEVSEPEQAEEPSSTERSGVLRVAMQPIVNIDPISISSDSEVLVANHVYDYLVDIDPANNPVPRLATSWEISDDGLTYVFQLAEGVTWHDGSPFTAEDVVWTFDRLRNTEGTPTADLYENIDSIEATGDLEVTFHLKQTNPFFLYDLSDNHALVLKAGTTDADTNFNGTGPFKVVNYSPEDRIEMVANENYFVPGLPKLAGLEIIFFNDQTAAVEALRSGQVDLVMRMSTSLFESLQGEPGINTIEIPTNGFDVIRLRSDRAPGNDPRVIQAFKLATDREAIFQLVQQGHGAVGRDTPIGPLYQAFYTDEFNVPERDPEAARALLAEAGYPDGLDMVLHTPDTGGRPDLAAVLKEQWAEAGINVEISVEPESVYYGEDGWLEVDLGITGWGSRPYPQFYLDVMLVSGAKWNESHFSDEEFDRLAAIAGTTLDEQERIEAYHEIQRILIERGPIIVPYFFAQFGAISNQFDGLELKAFAGRTDFRTVTFSGS
ncbi:MAG: ABC transporter substrate-binding protein [Chloroflexi bacterium]|nr:MAG: ABC transporter substrate-binding protein [Chloroflexota bacterium]